MIPAAAHGATCGPSWGGPNGQAGASVSASPPPLSTAWLTRGGASISQDLQGCHFPCCFLPTAPPLYCMFVTLFILLPACLFGRVWGRGFRDTSCPRRLCSTGSIIDWLVVLQEALQKIRQKNTMRREVTVELSSQGFWKTGIRSDVCQVPPVSWMHAHAPML